MSLSSYVYFFSLLQNPFFSFTSSHRKSNLPSFDTFQISLSFQLLFKSFYYPDKTTEIYKTNRPFLVSPQALLLGLSLDFPAPRFSYCALCSLFCPAIVLRYSLRFVCEYFDNASSIRGNLYGMLYRFNVETNFNGLCGSVGLSTIRLERPNFDPSTNVTIAL